MKTLLLIFILSGCNSSRDFPATKEESKNYQVNVLVDECHNRQCYQVIETYGLRCVAQFKGGIYCKEIE